MGELVIRCPETGRQIATGYHADATSFGQMPVFFGVTYCPICRIDHQWFARDALVLDQTRDIERFGNASRHSFRQTNNKQWMKLDEFVRAKNVDRYQRMLSESNDEAERRTIHKLLSEEMAGKETNSSTDPKR